MPVQKATFILVKAWISTTYKVPVKEEYGRLVEDRKLLREFIFPRVPTTASLSFCQLAPYLTKLHPNFPYRPSQTKWPRASIHCWCCAQIGQAAYHCSRRRPSQLTHWSLLVFINYWQSTARVRPLWHACAEGYLYSGKGLNFTFVLLFPFRVTIKSTTTTATNGNSSSDNDNRDSRRRCILTPRYVFIPSLIHALMELLTSFTEFVTFLLL